MGAFVQQLLAMGWIAVFWIILGFAFGLVYRQALRIIARGRPRGAAMNIGKSDRWFRALLGVLLLVWAVEMAGSPVLLIFSGFCFFEAIFSWCGFYAAFGRNTCPIA